jgi:hypothetical protein
MISVVVTSGLVMGILNASSQIDLKKALFIKIEKNVSSGFIKKMQQKASQRKIPLLINPKFSCITAGFGKKDLFASGTMYGTNNPDGSLRVSGEGDFKAYRYVRYKKGKRECRQTSYTKAYDPKRYGKESYAVIMMP